MDPEYIASEDEADAMAAAMGFSTFGTQGPSKKRKFNPKTDAFVEGQDLSSLDKGGRHGQGSGGNQIPLGKQRVFGVKTEAEVVRNEEEISLGEDGDEDEGPRYVDEEDEGPQYVDTSRPAPATAGRQRVWNEDEILLDEEEEDAGPARLNPSPLAPDSAASVAQKKIDAILAASSSTVPPALAVKERKKQGTKNAPMGGVGAFMAALRTPVVIPPAPGVPAMKQVSPLQTPFPSSLPQRPPPPSPSIAGSVAGSMGGQRGPRGQRNELWYVDYYDPSFNENPWKALEAERGLPEVGSWLQRPRGEGQGQIA